MLALLVGVIGLAGAWMLVIRPHAAANSNSTAPLVAPSHPAPKHTAPGAAGLGRAIDHAKAATGAANASVKRTENAVANAGSAPAAKAAKPAAPAVKHPAAAKPVVHHTTATKPAAVKHTAVKHAAVVKPSVPVTKLAPAKPVAAAETGTTRVNQALAAGKAVVLLFAGDGSDDAVARDVVRAVRSSHVVGIVTSITQLAKYDSLLSNVDVSAAPTIVVIAPNRQASEIVGLPDVKQVQSALRTVLGH